MPSDVLIKNKAAVWWVSCAIMATALFLLAISNAAYEITSPSWVSLHVLLRKLYSVVAFGLVGFLFGQARRAQKVPAMSTTGAAPAVAGYSALIEIGQYVGGSREGFGWECVDVGIGFVGGMLGDATSAFVRASPR